MERRSYKRVNEENKVIIEVMPDSMKTNKKEEIYAFTQDISLGGARILTDKFFPIGTVFRIDVFLGRSKQHFNVDGEVKWVKSLVDDGLFAIGVKFLHEVPKSVLTLLRHLYCKEEKIETTMRL